MARDYVLKTTQASWKEINIHKSIEVVNNKEICLTKLQEYEEEFEF